MSKRLLLFGIWAKVLFFFSVKKVMGWDLVTGCEVDDTKKSRKVEVEGCGGFGMSERIRERGRAGIVRLGHKNYGREDGLGG